jgi:hypothetical protein
MSAGISRTTVQAPPIFSKTASIAQPPGPATFEFSSSKTAILASIPQAPLLFGKSKRGAFFSNAPRCVCYQYSILRPKRQE